MDPKPPTRNPYAAIASASSSEEDTSSGDEHEAGQRRTTNRFILAPACREGYGYEEEEDSEGEGEPVRSSSVTAKQGPSPPLHLQGLPEPQTPPEGNVPSPKLTEPSLMKRTAAAAELAEPSPSKKRKRNKNNKKKKTTTKKKKKAPVHVPSKSPPPEEPAAAGDDHHTELPHMATQAKEVIVVPEKAVAAAGKEVAYYNAEKRLQEKSETYWYLAQAVKALEREHNTPGMYNNAFLNIDDGKATILNAKIKKQRMVEAKLFLKRCDVNKEVIRTLSYLIK